MFGKTFQKSMKELMAAGLAFVVLLLAYAQLGFLVSTCSPQLAWWGAGCEQGLPRVV